MKNKIFSEKHIEKVVRRNSVVYRCFTPDPAQAMIFGSGAAGGTLHTPDDSLYLLLGRCDNWTGKNRHGSIAGVRLRGRKGLFTKAISVRQVCNMFEARIHIYIDTGRGKLAIELTAIRGKDLILLDIFDKRPDPKPFTITLENWHEGDETSAKDGLIRTVHINRDSIFNDFNRRVGLEPEDTKDIQDPLLGRAWGAFIKAVGAEAAGNNSLELKANTRQRIRIALPGCAPASGADTLAEVEKQGKALVEIPEAKLQSWLNEHEAYWKDFWSKSFIDLESGTGNGEYEERLWYVTQYSIACAAGGGMPPRFNGAHYLLDKDERSWDPEYVFQNMREVYWPLFAAGHWPFIMEFFNLYFQTIPFVRMQTKKLLGLDGLIFREGYTIWGACVGINLLEQDEKKRYNIFISNYFSGSLELCLLMEWYYLASGDEKFLKEKFYPLLREVLAAYRQYARKGEDNRYHLEPVNATETWSSVRDSLPDICGLRHFLPRALAWGKRFGESDEILSKWQDFFDALAPLPVGRWTITRKYSDGIHDQEFLTGSELDPEGIFLPAAGASRDTERTNMENAELYIIFPWGAVGMDSPKEEVRRAENTWNHRTWKYINNGWAQDVLQLARMGWAESAMSAQLAHASYNQGYPNGTFICVAEPKFHGLLTNTPYFDTAGVHAAGLNEMLIQSYDGILRLVPAVSDEWSGSYKLHAFSGLIVEAVFISGRPVSARIHSTRESVVKLPNYRAEKMITVFNKKKNKTAPGSICELEMKAGDILDVRWQGVNEPKIKAPGKRPDVLFPGYKIHPPRRATRTGHWHDESINHGQVGLAEDGSFAATR